MRTASRLPRPPLARNVVASPRPKLDEPCVQSAPDAPDRWPEVARILDVVLDLTPGERRAFLDQAWAGNDELREEVEVMLAGAEADDFLRRPQPGLRAPSGRRERPRGTRDLPR